jgi:hypothetical protein
MEDPLGLHSVASGVSAVVVLVVGSPADDDDTVYTKKTKRHDSNALGMGCTAEYSCSEDSDYTF